MGRALLEEDVGFVEEENGVEGVGGFEDAFEGGFELGGVSAEFTAGYLVEGSVGELGDGCGKSVCVFLLTYCGHVTRERQPSAVIVFPTPGGPCSKMTSPFPLPLTKSSKLVPFV